MINISTIWENLKPTGDIIIKQRIEDIPQLQCYAATNNITGQFLYIMTVSNDILIPELNKYRFKSVEIFENKYESQTDINIYLLDNDLKDIFSLFIQNIVEEICACTTENEAVSKTLNIVSKWKKLFDKITFNGLTREQQHGLIGELIFFNYLLSNNISFENVLSAWTGADFKSKDFTLGAVGIEIKFTSAKQPVIRISNELQLDDTNLSDLFLVLYSASEVKDNGISLNSIVEQTRQRVNTEDELDTFNKKLQQIGYYDNDRLYYEGVYSVNKTFVFIIAKDFPKIVKKQLALGIYDASYSIEISAAENFLVDFGKILDRI